MPKYIKLQTDANVNLATPPSGAISLYYIEEDGEIIPKAKKSNGQIVKLSGNGESLVQGVITITDNTSLDRELASTFKLKVSGEYIPSFTNWREGDEGYIVFYGGSKITIQPLLVWDGLSKLETQIAVVKVFCIQGNMFASVIYESQVQEIITSEQITELVSETVSLESTIQNIDQNTYTNTDLYNLQNEVEIIQSDIDSLPGYSVEGIEEQLSNMNNNANNL